MQGQGRLCWLGVICQVILNLGQMIYAMLQLTSGMGKLLAMVEHDSG
jgi:hypothetical protein